MALRELFAIALGVVACARGTGAGETEGVSAAPTDDDGSAQGSADSTTQGSGAPSSAAAGGASASATVGAGSSTSGSGGAGGGGSSTSGAGGGSCDAQSCSACNVCVAGAACANEYTSCVSSFQCGIYGSCVQNCTNPSCVQTCQTFYPLGVQPYEAYAACLCAQCVTTCSGECA